MFKKSMFSIVSSFAILNFIGCDLGSNDFDRVQPRRVFLGEISKLLGGDWRGSFASESTAFSSDESIFGKHCVYFDLTPSGPAKPEFECHVYFMFGVEPGRSVEVAEKQPEGFDAWWFGADKNFENISFVLSGDEASIRKRGGVKLQGRIMRKWRSDSDFEIDVDLSSAQDANAWIKGRFIGAVAKG